MSSEDLTLCSVVSLRTNPVDYRPLVQHNLHKIDDTFDARYGVTIWCEGVIDELERLTIASLNNKLREELIEYVANCELPEFYQQEYFNLAHITTDLSVCDRELFIADTIYGIERTLDSYVLRLSPMTNRSMIDCLAEIAENLMISVVEKREKEGKRAGSTRSALTFSNLQKILTVSPLKVIEQIFSDESIEFNRPLVLTISHVERISEENLVQIILELKSLTNNLVVLSFAGCFSEVPYSDSVNLEGTMIVTQFSTESNYTYFNTIMEDLLLGDKLPFILSVALIDAIHRNFFSLERCVRTSIRRIKDAMSNHFTSRKSLLSTYKEAARLSSMKIISSRAAKEAIDGDNQKLFIDLLSLMSHQDLADTEVVVPVKHTINIVKKTNLSKDKEDLERINSLKIESSRASELMIENSNRLQLESLLFKILKQLCDTLVKTPNQNLSSDILIAALQMYRNGTVASSYRPVRSIISDLSIRLLNLKMEEFLSLVNMIKAVVKEYSTNKFTKDTYFDLVKECYRRISEIVFLFETALDDLSEVENINDRLLSSISKDARIVDNFVVDGILNDLENFLILIEGRLNSFEFPVGLQGIVMIDETISDHLLTQIFKNIQKSLASALTPANELACYDLSNPYKNLLLKYSPTMQKYPSNHAEKLKNKFAKRFAAIGSISDASLVYEHILKSGRTNVAGVWYSSFEESAIPWTVPNKVLKKRKARALDVDPSEVAETTMQGNSTSDVATADLKCRFASACYDLERTGIVKCRASENNTITVTRTAYGFIE